MLENILLTSLICFNAVTYNFDENSNNISKISFYCQEVALNEGMENPSDNLYSVKDLNNNIFYIQTGSDGGFMVYDPVASNFIEKSSTLTCPYDFSLDNDYYYFGPMNYYKRINDKFYSLVYDNETYDLDCIYELQNIFDKQLITFRENKNNASIPNDNLTLTSLNQITRKYIDNYEIIKNAKHPSNEDDSCGFVAASLILDYWDKTMHRGTVLDQFYDSEGNLNDTEKIYSPSTNLKDKLVEFNGGETTSWGRSVRDALYSYCNYANIGAEMAYYLFDIYLDSELDNNRPVIIFGAIPNISSNNKLISHAVTCYGRQYDGMQTSYIVNYGWEDDNSEVVLNAGFIVSITTFKLTESTYETNYTIKPSDYGYPCSYCSSRTTSSLNIGENKIVTNRLRCGYIENEYVNLSPRKEGFDTAYIEYNFTNPVKKIEINLSYWSNDERYGASNIAQVTFDYKNLTSDKWKNKYDFLEASDLPTNRNKLKLYTFEFEKGTKNVRLYTHFSYMSGKIDRNKGRISIGDMNVYTYR